jgi:membrane-anchored protein YejM (alkaline phosphatase superfamily)
MTIPRQNPKSVLFITLDSCRYDTFARSYAPNLKSVGNLAQAMAPGTFTYASHLAMFVGFTPSVAHKFEPFINSKFAKIFRMVHGGFEGKTAEFFILSGKNIIDGFKRQDYLTIGTGAVGWFNPITETAQPLIQDFDHFYFPGDTYSLHKQLEWIYSYLHNPERKIFTFLNIGETHVPYYYPNAPWSKEYNPCVPFSDKNDAQECRKRQQGCLEYVDTLLQQLLEAFCDSTIVICADHGDCWGEDGLWEHGFYHPKVLEVPFIYKLG